MSEKLDIRSWKTGEYLFEEGEISDSVFLITRGKVHLQGQINGKGGNKLIAVLGAGEVLGEAAFFEDHIHNLEAIAAEDTDAVTIHKKEARDAFASCPAIIRKTMVALYERLHGAYIFPIEDGVAPKQNNPLENHDQQIEIICNTPEFSAQFADRVFVERIPFTVANSFQRFGYAKHNENSLSLFAPKYSEFAIPHFDILERGGRLFIRDLGSPKGTIVNGVKVHRFGSEAYAPLKVGKNFVYAGGGKNAIHFVVIVPEHETATHLAF